MNNLFKKGFASLALASAMTSSIFAGNAAYIDIKVNYLGGKGVALIGYDKRAVVSGGLQRNKVELLVSVLDKDGAYATKDKNGKANIDTITLEGFSASSETNSSATIENNNSATLAEKDSTVVNPLGRNLDENDNIRRFVLDYRYAVESKLENEITFFTGTGADKLERKITINLDSVDAEGLLVRATPNGSFKTEKYINAHFYDINVSGGVRELNGTSSKAPGGLVGVSIPIQVYASLQANNVSVDGRFTFAPNLEGKTIVVTALADYNDSNTTETVLNSIELTMKNGQATGNIVITNGLPGGIDARNDVDPSNDKHFESALTEGLGIAFLAYVKDEIGINNYPGLKATGTDNFVKSGIFDSDITNWGSATDTIQVKSGEPAKLMVGAINRNARKASKLWTKTSSLITLVDGNDTSVGADGALIGDINQTHTATRTLTVVDSYGNPAIVSGVITSNVRFGSDTTSKLVKVTAGDVNIADTAGISTVTVSLSDSEDINNTRAIKPVEFTVDASRGMLAALDPVSLTVNTLPLIEWKVDGGSVWKKAIVDVNTTAAFTQSANFLQADDALRVTQNDFTVIIKSGIGDTNLTDQNSTFRVYIKDNSGESDSGYLEGSDLTKYRVSIGEGEGSGNFGAANLFGTVAASVAATGFARIDKTGDGYFRFDYNSSNATTADATAVSFTLVISKPAAAIANDVVLARIVVNNYNGKDNEEEVVIDIPTFEDQKVNAFVEVYSDGEVDKTETKIGTIINFKFTGAAVSTGDIVAIDINSSGIQAGLTSKSNTIGRIGLVGSDIADNKDGKITTALPENGIVSIVLYDTNGTTKDDLEYTFTAFDAGNATVPASGAVLINGVNPVWLYLKEDGDTDDITEYNTSDTFKMIRSDDSSIEKVRVNLTSTSSGDGSADDKRKVLPELATASIDPIVLKKQTVLTGTYYDIFDNETDVTFLDKYNNRVSGLKDELKKDVTFTATSGIEFDNDGTESWVKFKESAAGTEQTLTVSYEKDDKTKVSNTITWTKIKLSKQNSGFIITNDANGFVDPNTGLFSVENSEIIVKVIGNGNTKQSSTKITVTHADKDAKVRLVKVAGMTTSTIYENALSGLDSSIKDTIQVGGNYYVVSADKPGTMTIKVDSKVKDAKDNDVAITGTHSITFDAIDLDKPMVVESGVVASGGTITVEVTDKNLNTIATTVTVSDINDNTKSIVKAVYTDGKYVAHVSSAGIYQVEIMGVDMAENMQRFNFARTLGEGAATLEDALVAHGSYVIDGTFASYDFKDVDSSFDWVYTQGETMYQLNAKDSEDTSAFKWGEVTDITVGDTNAWSMIQLTGTAGSADASGAFGWVLVNAAGDTFKLAGANEDGTFKFSKALYVKGDISGSNVSFAKR